MALFKKEKENTSAPAGEAVRAGIAEEELHPAVITAHIIDTDSGIRTYEEVIAVRIHSRDFTLLIMADYSPIIGEIDGRVTIVSKHGDETRDHIRGFFKHQNNEFTLLIEESGRGAEMEAAGGETAADGSVTGV